MRHLLAAIHFTPWNCGGYHMFDAKRCDILQYLRRDIVEIAGAIKVPTAGSWNVEVNASRNGQLLGSYHARLNAQ